MFGTVLPKLFAGVKTALKNKKRKKRVKGRLKKKKGMLKGSIKNRLSKRNKRKYGGFLGGKNLNKKGKPKKPSRTKIKNKTDRRPASMRLRDAIRRSRPLRRSRKRTGLRKLKTGGFKRGFKRHLTYKGTSKKKGMLKK